MCCETHHGMGLKCVGSYWASSHFHLQPALADPSVLPLHLLMVNFPLSVLPHVLPHVSSHTIYYIPAFYLLSLCHTLFWRSFRAVSLSIAICSHYTLIILSLFIIHYYFYLHLVTCICFIIICGKTKLYKAKYSFSLFSILFYVQKNHLTPCAWNIHSNTRSDVEYTLNNIWTLIATNFR